MMYITYIKLYNFYILYIYNSLKFCPIKQVVNLTLITELQVFPIQRSTVPGELACVPRTTSKISAAAILDNSRKSLPMKLEAARSFCKGHRTQSGKRWLRISTHVCQSASLEAVDCRITTIDSLLKKCKRYIKKQSQWKNRGQNNWEKNSKTS